MFIRQRFRGSRASAPVILGVVVLLMFSSVSGAVPPESAVAGWPRQLGGGNEDSAAAVAVTAAGDVYVAGVAEASHEGGPDSEFRDVFLAKYDRNGNQKWARRFGTGEEDGAAGVAVSGNGDVYVGGSTCGDFPGASVDPTAVGCDVFLAKYDRNGNQRWVRQFGTTGSDWAYGMTASTSGDVYLTGLTDGLFPGRASAGGFDAFVTKYDKNGNQKWVRQFGTADYDVAGAVAISRLGDVYVVGRTGGALPGQTDTEGPDAFVARFDSKGTEKWARQFGSSGNDGASSVAVSAAGAVLIAGYTDGVLPGQASAGGNDVFVGRFDRDGGRLWLRQFGTASAESCNGTPRVAATRGSAYVATNTCGAFPGYDLQGPQDAVIAKFAAADGREVWVRQFGTPDLDWTSGIAVRGSDNNGGGIVAVGSTDGAVWGQPRFGGLDAFVATFPR